MQTRILLYISLTRIFSDSQFCNDQFIPFSYAEMLCKSLYKISTYFWACVLQKKQSPNISQNHFGVLSLRYYSNYVIQQCSLWLIFPSLFRVAWNFLLQCKLDDQGYRVSRNLSRKAITCNLDIYFRQNMEYMISKNQFYEVVQPMTIYNTAIYYYFSADHIMFITPDIWKPFAHHSSLRKIYS